MAMPSLRFLAVYLFLCSKIGQHHTESFSAHKFPNGRTTTADHKSTIGLEGADSTTFMNVFTTVKKNSGEDSSDSSAPTVIKRMVSKFECAPNGVCVDPEQFVVLENDDKSDSTNKDNGKNHKKYFKMRNVPGNGDCMFLAVALAAATSMGLGGNDQLLKAISKETREVVAQILSSPNGTLHIANGQTCNAQALLQQAARQVGLGKDTDRYLELLRRPGAKEGIQGGGPELTVLANVLRRPISIYELAQTTIGMTDNQDDDSNDANSRPIVCKGSFGLDVFEDPCASIPGSAVLSNVQPGAYCWQLHILILDVSPNGHEKHACVLLPQTPI